jgi:hypothetical protein
LLDGDSSKDDVNILGKLGKPMNSLPKDSCRRSLSIISSSEI